jgi:hypothetical protein
VSPLWELKMNKKIVLCFEQPEPRAHWLDVTFPPLVSFLHRVLTRFRQAFLYSFRVPSIMASRAPNPGSEGHAKAPAQQQASEGHEAKAPAQQQASEGHEA